jgi:hypothetical protein
MISAGRKPDPVERALDAVLLQRDSGPGQQHPVGADLDQTPPPVDRLASLVQRDVSALVREEPVRVRVVFPGLEPLPATAVKARTAPMICAHASAWAKLAPQTRQSRATTRPGKTGKGNRWLRGALGDAAMAVGKTDTFLGERYRRIRRRRGKQKAIVALARAILEIAYLLIADPTLRFRDLGADYYDRLDPTRQTRNKIREIERLNPGVKVTLAPAETAEA